MSQRKIAYTQPGAPLIHPSKADEALRDLMPVVECLTNYSAAMADGARAIAIASVVEALKRFEAIPARSPALPAYINWLAQNTNAAEAEGRE
jgi:hypothetical protein